MALQVPHDVHVEAVEAVASSGIAQLVASERDAGCCGLIYIKFWGSVYICTLHVGHTGTHCGSGLVEWDDPEGEGVK